MKSKTAILIAVISALLGVFFIISYISEIEEKSALDADPKSVLVAKKYIPAYSLVTLDMVRVSQVPSRYLQPGSITSTREIVDKKGNAKFITIVPIMENEVLLSTKFILPSSETGLAVVVPLGQRAISISVNDETSLSGLIKPGNRVDLIGNFEDKSVYLLQNLLVLSVDTRIIGEHEKEGGKKGFLEKMGEAVGGSTISLAVTPEQALKISYAKEKCSFNVVLRNMLDSGVEKVGAIDANNLLEIRVKPIGSIKVYKGVESLNEFLK